MDKQKTIQKLVPVQNKLKQEKKYSDITQMVIEDVKNIPDYKNRKRDVEFLLHIANVVEYLIKKKYGIDKKELVIHIADLIFEGIGEEDKVFISDTIDFLFSHNQIKPVQMISKASLYCCDYLNRKLL